jgi:hypothetical protein
MPSKFENFGDLQTAENAKLNKNRTFERFRFSAQCLFKVKTDALSFWRHRKFFETLEEI